MKDISLPLDHFGILRITLNLSCFIFSAFYRRENWMKANSQRTLSKWAAWSASAAAVPVYHQDNVHCCLPLITRLRICAQILDKIWSARWMCPSSSVYVDKVTNNVNEMALYAALATYSAQWLLFRLKCVPHLPIGLKDVQHNNDFLSIKTFTISIERLLHPP